MAVLVFLVYRVYVLLANGSLGKDIRVFGAIGFVVIAVMVYGMIHLALQLSRICDAPRCDVWSDYDSKCFRDDLARSEKNSQCHQSRYSTRSSSCFQGSSARTA